MPALAWEVGPAEGPASEGLQGRKPRSAGRELVQMGAAMEISPTVRRREMSALAADAAAGAGRW